MTVISKAIQRLEEVFNDQLKASLEAQRTTLCKSPERAVRALALQQMADYWERQAQAYLRANETFEAEECRSIASHALDFRKRILAGEF